jgi:hypothetical protein
LFFLLAARVVTAQGLIIPTGTYVIGNGGNIVLQNNWVNNGSFTHNGGTVIFGGTTQTLGGTSSCTFINLTVAAGSKTTIVSPGQQVSGVLLSNDTLYANGNLTLLSTASQTALINGSGTGEVLGNVIMQRYLPVAFGYKYFSSPFQADTAGNFSSVINLSASFPDLYAYNEALASAGWVNYTAGSGLLIPLAGYAVNFGSSTAALTVSLTGVVNNHTISSTFYNHNETYTQGFNLAGNPYASPIDWNSATGWTKTNIDNALYFFSADSTHTDQYGGTYSSYINGVSSNGVAGNIIAAMQGFFIHVSNGSYPVTGVLSVNNNARNTNSAVTFLGVGGSNEPAPLLRLSAGFADQTTVSDPVVVYLKDGASTSFDPQLDALKLMNTHPGVPSLYTVSTDSKFLSIQALSLSGNTLQTVPLGLTTAQDGWVSFQTSDILQMPSNLYVYFFDRQSGARLDLKTNTSYRVYLVRGAYEGRFFLELSPTPLTGTAGAPATSGSLLDAYYTGSELMVRSNLPVGEKAGIDVLSATGQLIYREEVTDNSYHAIHLPYIAAGVYIVSLADGHNIYAKKIFIGEHP